MAHLGQINFFGVSGKTYPFEAFPFETEFKQIPAVYVISSRYLNPNGGYSHKVIYIDHTDSLLKKFERHPRLDHFIINDANAVSVLPEKNMGTRLAIVNDLRSRYNNPMGKL